MSDTGEPTIDPTTGSDYGSQEANPDDLASPFLAKIPEVDRNVVAKYINEWNRGVTQRFQSIHDQYRPFKGADPDEYQNAIALTRLVNEQPEQVFQQLAEHLGYDLEDDDDVQYQGSDNPWAEYGVPDELAQEFQQMREINEALAAKVMSMDTATQDEADQQALDDLLDDLHEQYGEYNEDFVMTQILRGMNPEQAVQAWNQEIQNSINSRGSSKPPPTILGGSGTVPQSGVDPRKMSGKDVRQYIADQLTHANQER